MPDCRSLVFSPLDLVSSSSLSQREKCTGACVSPSSSSSSLEAVFTKRVFPSVGKGSFLFLPSVLYACRCIGKLVDELDLGYLHRLLNFLDYGSLPVCRHRNIYHSVDELDWRGCCCLLHENWHCRSWEDCWRRCHCGHWSRASNGMS